MTAQPRPLDDATIEAAAARRAGGDADAALLTDIMAAARTTPQVRGWWPPLLRSRQAWVVLAAALLLAAAVIVGVGAGRPTPPPAPAPSAAAIVVPPSASAPSSPVVSTPSPAASPAAMCPPAPAQVATGPAMPPATSEPMTVLGDSLDLGVFVASADIWSVRTGAASRIASFAGTDLSLAQVDDVSPDGRFAVVELGQAIPNSPFIACDNLYLVATDGTGATRFTTFGTHQHASDARFSRDGRFVAYRYDDLHGHTPVVGLIDLVGDHTPRIVECGETSMFDLAWAPDDDRLAMVCGGRLDVVSAETGNVVSSTVLPFKGEIFMELAWSDPATMVLVTALDNGIGVSNAAVRLRTVAAGVVSGPKPVSPQITFAGALESTTAPDGGRVAVVAFSRDQTMAWYVIDTATGLAQAVAGPGCSDLGWSSDGRSVVFVDGGPATTAPALTLVDVSNGARHPLGWVPAYYRGGVFRAH